MIDLDRLDPERCGLVAKTRKACEAFEAQKIVVLPYSAGMREGYRMALASPEVCALVELARALIVEHAANEAALASLKTTAPKCAPWVESPYKPVSLGEILDAVAGPQPDPKLAVDSMMAVAKVRALVRLHLLPAQPERTP